MFNTLFSLERKTMISMCVEIDCGLTKAQKASKRLHANSLLSRTYGDHNKQVAGEGQTHKRATIFQ